MSEVETNSALTAKLPRTNVREISEFLHDALGWQVLAFIAIGERGWKGIRLRSIVDELAHLERER